MKHIEIENGLERKLGLFPLTNIVIANMIGAGIFTTSGLLMEELRDPAVMILLWAAGGVIALCGALSYGELGAAIPSAGGEYAFLSRLYHPMLGFLSGWISFFAGFSAPIAASATGCTEYVTRIFPELLTLGLFEAPLEATVLKKLYSILVIAAFTFIHARGVELGSRIQNLLTLVKVLLIAVLIAGGFLSGGGDFGHFSEGEGFRFDFSGFSTIGLSLMWIMFAYSGWNASAYIGSEIVEPSRNIPRSLLYGTGIVILLYLGLNLLYIYAIPPQRMNGVISIGGLAALYLFGESFEGVLSILIAFALFSSLSAFIILGPRVYYSMARNGYFFRFAAEVHDRYKVPWKSIIMQGVIASMIVALGTFDQILTYMGFSLGIFPILAVFGIYKLRRSGMGNVRLPGFPIVQAIYILASISILILAFLERSYESSIAIITVLLGIPTFFLFERRYRRGKAQSRT